MAPRVQFDQREGRAAFGRDAHGYALASRRTPPECRTNKPRFPTRSGYSCDDEPASSNPQPRTGQIVDALPSPDLHGIGEALNDEDELRSLSGVDWTFSRIDPNSGEYIKVGTIERLSRFLDAGHEAALFGDQAPGEQALARLVKAAGPFFKGRSDQDVEALLVSARKLEASSRHKANPNIPSLGDREALVNAGLWTNHLPGCD